MLLGKGFEEEGEHAVAGDVGEGGEFERIMAAGEFEGARVGAVAAEGVQHLAGEFGEHGGVIFAVDHEGVAASPHTALDVGHGTDRGQVVAEFVYGNMVAKALPDVIGGHALADDVGVVGGDVEETAGADAFIVNESDIADRRAHAGAENAEFGVALLLEPVEAAAGVLNSLAVGLKGEADIGAADLVGALMAAGHAAVVIGHAHLENGDSQALNPVAKAILAVPFGVPVGEKEDGGACAVAFPARPSGDGLARGKELGVHGIVFRPGRFDGTGKSENVFAIEAVIGGGRSGVPFRARFDDVVGVFADKSTRIWLIG